MPVSALCLWVTVNMPLDFYIMDLTLEEPIMILHSNLEDTQIFF